METPYEYHEKKLGVKIKYLIYDLNFHEESLKLVSWNALNKRMHSERRTEKQLRRSSLGCDALILHSSLTQDWKDQLAVKFGKPKEEIKKSWFSQHYTADRKAFDFYIGYTYGDKVKLDPAIIEKYVWQASVLNTVLLMKNNRKQYLKTLGPGTTVDIWESLSRDVNAFTEVDHKLPTTKSSLRFKVDKYAKEGYSGLISDKFGMKNALKIKEREQQALIDELVAKHTNLPNELICNLYNIVAEKMGWNAITAQTVGNRKKESNLITYAGRNGVSALSNNILMQNKRSAPTMPMLYWTLDGWDAELLYQKTTVSKSGNTTTTYHNRLAIVIVLDAFSKYPIGYAIGTHETPALITEALANAVNHTEELFGQRMNPQQIQSDKYQQKVMTPIYSACSGLYTPARVKNAKSKIIEPYFSHLNKNYCRLLDNWSGFNVNSGSKNQPNTEVLNKLSKTFPDEQGCRMQLVGIIEAERAKKVEDYVNSWQKVPEDLKIPMHQENFLLALGRKLPRTAKLTGSGLNVTIEGVKEVYDCFDLEFRKQSHQDWQIIYDPKDINNVLAVSGDKKYRFMLEKKHIQAMAIVERGLTDAFELKRVSDFNKNAIAYITNEREQNAVILENLFEQPALGDTLAKHLLVDSHGRHKDHKSRQRLEHKGEKLLEKQIAAENSKKSQSWQIQQDEYNKSKINLNEYL